MGGGVAGRDELGIREAGELRDCNTSGRRGGREDRPPAATQVVHRRAVGVAALGALAGPGVVQQGDGLVGGEPAEGLGGQAKAVADAGVDAEPAAAGVGRASAPSPLATSRAAEAADKSATVSALRIESCVSAGLAWRADSQRL